jgi:LysM repeat protein
MKKVQLIFLILIVFETYSQITATDYIEKYSKIAVKEMKRNGIPASITLSQGMLESANGNSTLATEANNHFGIKCHSSWKGPKIYKDDDQEQECFRKYKSVEESFIDHSEFLTKQKRYALLFEIKTTNYKDWAKGLKQAGYATNPQYPERLIYIIEENKLYQFDIEINNKDLIAQVSDNYGNNTTKNSEFIIKKRPKPVEDYEFQIGYDIYLNNNVKYIIAKKGDDFKKITKKLGKMAWELPKFNELDKNNELQQGQIIYIQPKRNRAEKGNEYHIVKAGETIYSISQFYGIKTKSIRNKNKLVEKHEVTVGEKLWLRKTKK